MNIFSPEQLSKIVANTLPADAKPNEKVLVGAVDKDGAQVVARMKFKEDRWTVQAAWRHDWATKDNSAGAEVFLRW